ncbi:MAG TPA: hypothetical protein VEX18_08910, partial [Polyangiaceae bacterium]|nr:hypothetical protein [Polyangiaceae bacterium]
AAAAAAAVTVATIACTASGACGDAADKVKDKIKDVCEPKSPGPGDWKCIQQGVTDTGGGQRCQYSCTNGTELRPIFRPIQPQTPAGRNTRICPGSDHIEKLLKEGSL